MLVRIVNMHGMDLNIFAFDHDLTWAAFFLSADGHVYGRFGGRDDANPDKYLTLTGLKYAMRQALEAHRQKAVLPPSDAARPPRTPEQSPAAARLKPNACIHCHQVHEFRRDELRAAGKWTRDAIWALLPPEPRRLGLELDPVQGNRLRDVPVDSPAGRAGLRPGDVLRRLNGQPTASFADVQFALHAAPGKGRAPVVWERRGKEMTAELELPEGWRKSDISWRAFMWGLEPSASVYGTDLTPEEKKKLGLPEKGLAFRQGDYVPGPARAAGIRGGDIICGFDGQSPEMTMLQFNTYVRLNREVGERITFDVLRDGKRLKVSMTLPRQDW